MGKSSLHWNDTAYTPEKKVWRKENGEYKTQLSLF